jgi:hypothetical protein
MEIFMIGAWILWKERNDFIFNHKPPSVAAWKVALRSKALEHLVRIKSEFHFSIVSWLDAL